MRVDQRVFGPGDGGPQQHTVWGRNGVLEQRRQSGGPPAQPDSAAADRDGWMPQRRQVIDGMRAELEGEPLQLQLTPEEARRTREIRDTERWLLVAAGALAGGVAVAVFNALTGG